MAGRPGGSKTRSAGAAYRTYSIAPPSGVEVCPQPDWRGKTWKAPSRSDVRVIAATAGALVCACRRVRVPFIASRPSLDRSAAVPRSAASRGSTMSIWILFRGHGTPPRSSGDTPAPLVSSMDEGFLTERQAPWSPALFPIWVAVRA